MCVIPLVCLLTLTADTHNRARKGDVEEAESHDPVEHESNAALRSLAEMKTVSEETGATRMKLRLKGAFSPLWKEL